MRYLCLAELAHNFEFSKNLTIFCEDFIFALINIKLSRELSNKTISLTTNFKIINQCKKYW